MYIVNMTLLTRSSSFKQCTTSILVVMDLIPVRDSDVFLITSSGQTEYSIFLMVVIVVDCNCCCCFRVNLKSAPFLSVDHSGSYHYFNVICQKQGEQVR